MSIAETSQLLQLILNSVLLMGTCALLLTGLAVRYGAVCRQRRGLQRSYQILLRQSDPLSDRLPLIRAQLRQLRRQYRWVRAALMFGNLAILLSVGSTFNLALRTLWQWDQLIQLALLLFLLSSGMLLVSLSLWLMDCRLSHRWVAQDHKLDLRPSSRSLSQTVRPTRIDVDSAEAARRAVPAELASDAAQPGTPRSQLPTVPSQQVQAQLSQPQTVQPQISPSRTRQFLTSKPRPNQAIAQRSIGKP